MRTILSTDTMRAMRPRIAICRHATRDDASAVALALAHTSHAGIEVSLWPHDPKRGVEAAASLVAMSGGETLLALPLSVGHARAL